MKANRAFKSEDEAVSPVIAVILMVAITVVLAATVYVWVSGFGQSGSQAKNLSVSQVSCSGSNPVAKFTIVSVSPNFAFASLRVVDATTGRGTDADGGTSSATADTSLGLALSSGTNLGAGETLTITSADANDMVCTDTLNFIDTSSNTVVSTITLHS